MSILNKCTISAGGQPVFPLKGSDAQEADRHHPTSLPFHGTRSEKPSQSGSAVKRIATSITSGETLESPGKATGADFACCTLCVRGPFFLTRCPEGLPRLIGTAFFAGPLLQFDAAGVGFPTSREGAGTDAALVVCVASAVELDERQVDLIARKMRGITGFANLKMENRVDRSLIAGFVISYGDDASQVIDLSVKSQLVSLAARVASSDGWVAGHGEGDWNVL